MKETPLKRTLALTEDISQSLLSYLDKPFVFFGHSMGALTCFEMARHLRREHSLQPIHIFVSGCTAPQLRDPGKRIFDLPESEFLDELRRLNGTPHEVLENPDLMQLMLPILRSDFEVVGTYEYIPESPLTVPITAFGGLQDKDASRPDLEGWQDQTTAPFTLRMFPGDHFFLHSAEPLLLRTLTQDLHAIVNKRR